MYWRYAVRRILYAVVMYAIVIFIFSALFNAVAETTQMAQITEQVNAESRGVQQASQMRPEEIQQWRADRRTQLIQQYHLDEPIVSRIFWRTLNTLTFNLGQSTQIRSSAGENDVWLVIKERIPRTLILFMTAVVIDVLIGVWLGLRKARKAGGLMDRTTSIVTMVLYGLPSWWLGMLMIMIFAFTFPIFPSGSMHSTPAPTGALANFVDLLYHMALPVIALVLLRFWGRAYITRNIVLGTLQEDFIMSARARGITERKVLYGHTLRSSAPPIVTMSLLALLASFGGALIFEGIFSWPGMGNLYWVAVQQNDVPVLMGNLALTTGLYIAGLALLDLIYGLLDPRVKVGGKA